MQKRVDAATTHSPAKEAKSAAQNFSDSALVTGPSAFVPASTPNRVLQQPRKTCNGSRKRHTDRCRSQMSALEAGDEIETALDLGV